MYTVEKKFRSVTPWLPILTLKLLTFFYLFYTKTSCFVFVKIMKISMCISTLGVTLDETVRIGFYEVTFIYYFLFLCSFCNQLKGKSALTGILDLKSPLELTY